MTVDPSGAKAIYVCSLASGDSPIATANAGAPEGQRLRSGDFVFAVNGVSGDLTSMMKELQATTTIEFSVRRPFRLDVSINRRGSSVGCGITYDANTGVSLVIESINEGCISKWNRENPERVVKTGDRIVSVNGQTG